VLSSLDNCYNVMHRFIHYNVDKNEKHLRFRLLFYDICVDVPLHIYPVRRFVGSTPAP
jgi:hypothetical protein